MNKKLIALAVAGAMAAPLAAQAEVSVYGVAHVSVDNVSGENGPLAESDMSVTSRFSRVGVKGAEDLGGGMKAVFQMEWQVDMSETAGAATNLTSRNQIVGLAGGFGTVALGRHDTPYKMSTGKLDVFADTAADYNFVIGSPAGVENRGNNVVAYLSPNFNGFNLNAAMVAAEDGEDVAAATSVSLTYNQGPLFVAVAAEQFEDAQEGVRAGVGYDFGMAKVGAVFESVDDPSTAAGVQVGEEYTAWLVNVAMPFGGNNTLIAEYGVGEFDDADTERTLAAVGVAHSFSKATSAYAAYGNVDVETAGAGDDSSIITVGLVHKF